MKKHLDSKAIVNMAVPLSLMMLSHNVVAEEKKMNVLFLVMDDLRPELNCYGHPEMTTPNIDKLSKNGVQFNQAFCNIPVSGASRASLMTGLRPTRDRFLDVEAEIEQDAPGISTLPKYMKSNGYTTLSNSKVIHGKKDALDSWSEIWYPKVAGKSWRNYLGDENQSNDTKKHGATAYECIEAKDDQYIDGMTAAKTIEQLRTFKQNGKPFFIATGILKPHLPFNAPKKYWDLYKKEDIQLPSNYEMDRSSFPKQAFHSWNELRFYKNIPDQGRIQDDNEAKTLIQGYKACVSYADAQVGLILDELVKLGLDKNTMIVMVGDHGWSLGNHGDWCKHSNFGIVDRTTMIIAGPGLPKDKKIDKVVELIDLYPTVCSLANLPIPTHTQGGDLSKLMKGDDPAWKNYAVVKWHDGLGLMTQEYRYTEWLNSDDKVVNRMLFNIQKDADENKNLANDSKYESIMKEMSASLRKNRGESFLSTK